MYIRTYFLTITRTLMRYSPSGRYTQKTPLSLVVVDAMILELDKT